MGLQQLRFVKVRTHLLNTKELEENERLGINQPVTQAEVISYYCIDSANLVSISEFADNEGYILENKSNLFFQGDVVVTVDISPLEFINNINGIIIL